MNPRNPLLASLACGLLLAGCSSTPSAPPSGAAAPQKTAVAPAQSPASGHAEAPPAAAPAAAETDKPCPGGETHDSMSVDVSTVPLTPEAREVAARLRAGGGDVQKHKISMSTGFPEAMTTLHPGRKAPEVAEETGGRDIPTRGLTAEGTAIELVEKDWSGVVLVPVNAQVSKAYTSAVRIVAIEAHPLMDGRIRVWMRVRNIENKDLTAEVGCMYRMRGTGEPPSPRFYRLPVPGGAMRDVFFISPAGTLTGYTVLIRSGDE